MTYTYEAFVCGMLEELTQALELEPEQLSFQEGDTPGEDCFFIYGGPQRNHRFVLKSREIYDQYGREYTINQTAEIIAQDCRQVCRLSGPHQLFWLEDYEALCGHLMIKAMPAGSPRLSGIRHCKEGDIALALYLSLNQSRDHCAGIGVGNRLLDFWGKSFEEVFPQALANTAALSPPRIFRLEKMLQDAQCEGEEFMGLAQIDIGPFGLCISNRDKVNGAVVVFLPGVASQLSQILGGDFYLAFTSVHEVMVHPAASIDPEQLQQIQRETIEEATRPEDFLTDRLYVYEKENAMIRVWEPKNPTV